MQVIDQKRTGKRHFPLTEQAKALAVILQEEFGMPFAFYNAQTGAEETPADRPDLPSLDMAMVHQLATAGRARVWALGETRYQLALLLYEAQQPVLVATGEIAALARTPVEARREQVMLEKWVQAVSDRLRLNDQLSRRRQEAPAATRHSNTAPWEALLGVDYAMRKLRFDREPDKNSAVILETAFGFLGARTLIWVPRNGCKQVLVQGEACLAPADCRHLASLLSKSTDPRSAAPVIFERFQEKQGAARFPHIANLLALPVTDKDGLVGWAIALNKNVEAAPAGYAEAPGFRKSDAALLTPFVALLELQQRGFTRYLGLKDLLVGLTRSLTTAIDAKDSYTFGHSERVARIAVELARDLGMDGDELGDIYLAGLLHDVGKIGIRDEVLGKPGKLTPEEQAHIQQHVIIGYEILADLRQIRNLLPGVLYHHERWDGAGYPDGLAGENIPLLARILAVADSYDAMTTARPYRDPLPWNKVEQILTEGAGSQWDKRIIEAFHRCKQKIHTIRQRGVGESLRHAIDGALRTDSDSGRFDNQGVVRTAPLNPPSDLIPLAH